VPNLKEKGIEVITGEKDRKGNRVIKIHKLPTKLKKREEKITTDEEGDNANDNNNDKLFNIHIHRLDHSDIFDCDRCTQKGDIHYMRQHKCNQV
jgi:hypothetical protein